MIVFLANGVVAGELPLRSELLSIIGMILDTMGLEWSQGYLVFPVRYFLIPVRILFREIRTDASRFTWSPSAMVEDELSKPISMEVHYMFATRVGTTS